MLAEILLARADERPGDIAFADRDRTLTYSELAERSSARAASLQRAGVQPGDRVVVALPAGLEAIEVFWALQLVGAVPSVLNPGVPAATLERRAAIVRPKLVITGSSPEALLGPGREFTRSPRGPDDAAFLQFTSGSTGEPRASVILNRNVLSYLHNARRFRPQDVEDVFVSWVPPWHDLGLVLFVIAPVHRGAACHLVEPAVRTIPEWLRTITRVAGTVSAAPDFALRLASRLVDPTTVDLRSLRHLTCGGEPVRWSTMEAFGRRFSVGDRIAPGYGLGEATLTVTTHLPGEDIAVDERGNVSCGMADSLTELRAGSSLGEPAEILVRGPQVFAGYFDAPEETSRALRDGWLHTGDWGYLDAEGRLFVLGRRAGMIKRAGALISPRELEEAAVTVPGIQAAGAIALSVAPRSEELIAVAVELERSARDTDRDVLTSEVAAAIHRAVGFECHRVSVVGRLPRTENGKLRYGALREELSAATRDTG